MIEWAGFGLGGFRSFHKAGPQVLAPLSRINLIAGQNNSGKSNILRFIQVIIDAYNQRSDQPYTSDLTKFDWPFRSSDEYPLEFLFGFRFSSQDLVDISKQQNQFVTLRDILELEAFKRDGDQDIRWFHYQFEDHQNGSFLTHSSRQLGEAVQEMSPQLLNSLPQLSSPHGRHGIKSSADINALREMLSPLPVFEGISTVSTIGAFRQVRLPHEKDQSPIPGTGLIERLDGLKRPTLDKIEDEEKFHTFTKFVRMVLEDESLDLDIPHDRSTLHIKRNGTTFPLESLGTGIQQILILAAEATTLENQIICVEEPENHLHPLLQRRLLSYLKRATSNRYFIATHSAHMLDSQIASVFHVTHDDDGSHVSFVSKPRDQAAVCADLGYRPSDLVQSNAIIWVEGPSDRIYLQHWISLIDKDFVEGIDYSIMFYGGRLLNHLTADDEIIGDFIALRRINQNMAILIDSDKKSEQEEINATKLRIVKEFDSQRGLVWVTKGYTIENYVPLELWGESLGKAHPKVTNKWNGEPYVNPCDEGSWSGSRKSLDKLAVARSAVENWTESAAWPHDLREQVEACVRFIREANGH